MPSYHSGTSYQNIKIMAVSFKAQKKTKAVKEPSVEYETGEQYTPVKDTVLPRTRKAFWIYGNAAKGIIACLIIK